MLPQSSNDLSIPLIQPFYRLDLLVRLEVLITNQMLYHMRYLHRLSDMKYLVLITVFSFLPFALQAGGSLVVGSVTIVDRDGGDALDYSNVVVFVDGVALEEMSSNRMVPKVTHKGRRFAPRVLALVKGTTVSFFNDDDIFHNVFSLSKAKPFDLGIYPEGASKLVEFDRAGLVKLYCQIHPSMVGNILVLNNSLYAITGADGKFRIENVPDGDFVLRAWHESAVELQQPLSVRGNLTYELTFVLEETKKIKQHKNKFGKHYKKKY